ncbi:MAG: S-layer homology domain-containing protein [Actinobacteria bacterium]|nr:S-layer homology domain-containing protein [Actinomycetota bacterium]
MRRVAIAVLIILLAGVSPDIALTEAESVVTYKTDPQGVRLTDYGSTFGGLGIQYNPVSIANYALDRWNKYQETSDQAYLDAFMNQAKWLHDNQRNDGTWKYTFNIPSYNLDAPWISCMAQGLGMQVLNYAYSINREQSYLDKAKLSIRPFSRSVKDGGVRSYFPDGIPWYEEYASDSTPVYKVLNGFMFALQGIASYLIGNGDEDATRILNEGLSSLSKKIDSYDAGYASYYDAAGHVNVNYNRVHVEQLMYLYKLTGNERLREYARIFDTYEPKAGIRASSVASGQQDPAILVDGKCFNGSTWERGSWAAQLQLDLGSSRPIEGVNFFFADRINVPSSIQMAVSADGISWSNIVDSALNPRWAYYPSDTKSMYIRMHYLKQPIKARFIRIILNQGSSKLIRLREIHPMYNQNASRFDRVGNSTRWNDIYINDWYYPYVRFFESSGLATGYADGSFRPGNPITRAELTVWISRAYGFKPVLPGSQGPIFPDIESHWARSYIEAVGDIGIVSGYPDGTFKPDALVTRAEIAKIIVGAGKLPLYPIAQFHFSDVSIGYWAIPYIEAAREAGIIKGYDGLVFKPDAHTTRAEATAILVRALNVPTL